MASPPASPSVAGRSGRSPGARAGSGGSMPCPLRYAVAVNSVSSIMLNKLDILSGVDPLRICVAYEIDGRRVETWPSSGAALSRATPIYEEFDGWTEPINTVRSLGDLPENARRYVTAIERPRRRARSCSCRSGRSAPRRSSGPFGRCAAGRGSRHERRARRDADADPHRRERRSRACPRLAPERRAWREHGVRRAGQRCHRGRTAESRRLADVDPLDGDSVVAAAREVAAELVVIGPEAPLAAGVADALEAAGIAVFGPTRGRRPDRGEQGVLPRDRRGGRRADGAFRGVRARPPTPPPSPSELAAGGTGIVVKADGLAAGKGVTVCDTLEEALDGDRHRGSSRARWSSRSGSSGREASLIALCDGRDALALPIARDHKRLGDADTGPNTGGMGAYSPLPDLPDAAADDLIARFHRADPGRAGPPRHPVPWRALRWPHAHRGRAGPARMQRPVRRSRDAGHPAPARRPARAVAARGGSRTAARGGSAARPGGRGGCRPSRSPRSGSCSRPPATRTRHAATTRSAASIGCARRRGAGVPRRHRPTDGDGTYRTDGGRIADRRRARPGPRSGACAGGGRRRPDRVRRAPAPPRHRRRQRPGSEPLDDPPLHARRDGRDLVRGSAGSSRCSASSSPSPAPSRRAA